ncbi:hypothetical protein J422_03164 [Methanocaldococcus villosus KIN24-T80]|uniref:Uncharacterized protein n=1 Tax=Methanocaldococcus villosus KIN24-T80 TaxID=1069083 RepID=N6VT01_9EURY|nr:DUF2096 family protein [Methanocaldococcus villosus]ENN96326.1 hypothetical protein J422_03164 [Methanocaldococcus villosus KIN24-T80]
MKDARNLEKIWVVLSEMSAELVNKNIPVPEDVFDKLRLANSMISYYLLDPHVDAKLLIEIEKVLNNIQSKLFTLCDEELMNIYLNKLNKAIRGELEVSFPISKSNYNKEVLRKGNVERVRIKLQKDIAIERLGELGEWYGVIFEYSEEKDKILIEGEINRIKTLLKDFSVIWKSD